MTRLALRIAAMLFALSVLVYAVTAAGHMQTGDNRSELAVAQSIVQRGDFTVRPTLPDVYVPSVASDDGTPYGSYGLGASLILVPAAAIGSFADCPTQPGGCPSSVQHVTDFAASFVDGAFAAFALAVLFLFAVDLGAGLVPSLVLALVFGFATIQWPYAHNAFDIGPSATFVLLGLFALHGGVKRRQSRWLLASGAAMGFAVFTRLQTGIFLPIFGVYLLWEVRSAGWRNAARLVLAWVAPIAIGAAFVAWYNWSRFGSPLDGGQVRGGGLVFSTPLVTGLKGQLLSPGKSLFLFSPPLLIGVVALPVFLRRHLALGLVIVTAVTVNLVFYGKYYEWAGDYAWGPRYTVLLTALLILPAISVLDRWRTLPWVARMGVIVTGVAGVFVQLLGVSVDFLHQMLLERFQGIDARTYYSIQYSGIWRHGMALWQMLQGSAPYPTDQTQMDLSLGLPTFTTVDFWWVYALINGVSPILVFGILIVALALIGVLCRQLVVALTRLRVGPAGRQHRIGS